MIALTRAERRLSSKGRANQKRWERAIMAPARFGWRSGGAARPDKFAANLYLNGTIPFGAGWAFPTVNLDGIHAAFARMVKSMRLPAIQMPGRTAMRTLWVAGSLAFAGTACAALMVAYSYVAHPAEFWEQRIRERTQSPIFDRDGLLIGGISTAGALDPKDAYDLAFIPLQSAPPPVYLAGLLAMENRNFLSGGWHNLCGIDVPSMFGRWLTLKGGGSGVSQQLAKELKQPEWGHGESPVRKVFRKFQEIGASCQLYNYLVDRGGEAEVLRLYASYAPVFIGNGTLRGIEAGARIVFDVAPNQLSAAQQLIFAAAVISPLALVKPEDLSIKCEQVYPKLGNPSYDEELARTHKARTGQCRVLHRAISMAAMVLTGDELTRAISELREYQEKGIFPANPFEKVSAKRLVNLSTRTATALPTGLVDQIRREAEEVAPGAALHISLDAVKQHEFSLAMTAALDQIQRSPQGRNILCLPLVSDSSRSPVKLRSCGGHRLEGQSADIMAVQVDMESGGIRRIYSSSPLLMNSFQSIGSVAKWPIMIAALAAGFDPQTMVCPKAADDGNRPLNRVTSPKQGFANCDGGRNMISFERAIAKSDSLAFYDVARTLGPTKLKAALDVMGLPYSGPLDELPYRLAFGTFGARPRDLVAASQNLFALGYDHKVTERAPHILESDVSMANAMANPLASLLHTPTQRESLRTLLEAPVEFERGTLGFIRNQVTAGKSGTVSSAIKDSTGHHYGHAKWAVTYQRERRTLNLFFVAAPLPSIPLAQHTIEGSLLAPAHRILLAQE
jgi:hypothetical protein